MIPPVPRVLYRQADAYRSPILSLMTAGSRTTPPCQLPTRLFRHAVPGGFYAEKRMPLPHFSQWNTLRSAQMLLDVFFDSRFAAGLRNFMLIVQGRCSLSRARLRLAHSFNRVGNAPRFVFQISNLKFQIRNFKYNNRGPLGTRLNVVMPTAWDIVSPDVHRAGHMEVSR